MRLPRRLPSNRIGAQSHGVREIDELETSNTRRIIVAVVGLAVIAVAIGLLFKQKGIGEPEQDHRVLIIEDQTRGFDHYAGELGFDAFSGSLEGWQSELARQDKTRSAGEFTVADVIEFADRHGYGYVAIEHPARFATELAALELEEPLPSELDAARFAVLSVGDFAGPHQLSIDPPTQALELGPGPSLLRAMFAHPRLGQALDPNVAATDLQTARMKLEKAIDGHERLARDEQRAATLRSELAAELDGFVSPGQGQRRATVLHDPLAGASAYPLADGRVLLHIDALKLGAYGDGLELRSASDELRVIPADAPARADASVACPELTAANVLRVQSSVERDAVFVLERGDVGTLFEVDAAAGPCGLRQTARLELPPRDDSYLAVSRHAVATRDIDDDDTLRIEIIPATAELPSLAVRVTEPRFDNSASLVWLDERRLANLVDIAPPPPPEDAEGDAEPLARDQAGLVIIDLDHPDRPLVLELWPDGPDTPVLAHELQRVPNSGDREPALLLRWSADDSFTLSRLDFDRPWAELIDDGEGPPEQPTLRWTKLASVDSHMRGFDIDPTGRQIAMTYEAALGVGVGIVALPAAGGEPGPLRVLLDDSYEHREVAFRPGHDELLFRTRIRLEQPKGSMLVVHALPLGG